MVVIRSKSVNSRAEECGLQVPPPGTIATPPPKEALSPRLWGERDTQCNLPRGIGHSRPKTGYTVPIEREEIMAVSIV